MFGGGGGGQTRGILELSPAYSLNSRAIFEFALSHLYYSSKSSVLRPFVALPRPQGVTLVQHKKLGDIEATRNTTKGRLKALKRWKRNNGRSCSRRGESRRPRGKPFYNLFQILSFEKYFITRAEAEKFFSHKGGTAGGDASRVDKTHAAVLPSTPNPTAPGYNFEAKKGLA